jgi:hypothetical protein
MLHRFKLGQMVDYRPADRVQSAVRGMYEITGLLPGPSGQPEYRIKHASEEHERVAVESELSVGHIYIGIPSALPICCEGEEFAANDQPIDANDRLTSPGADLIPIRLSFVIKSCCQPIAFEETV